MENNPMRNVETWVDDRLASLDAGFELPSAAGRILARVNVRERKRRATRSRIMVAGTFGSLACLSVAAVMTLDEPELVPPPPVVPARISVQPFQASTITPAGPVRVRVSKPSAIAGLVPPTLNFKESGSPTALVTMEIYIDYECPPCATFFSETMPPLVSQYVETGKIKLLRRDFPLPQHKYADLAARYANAAGMLGHYSEVSEQIFRTQPEWHKDGDIDRQVAAVLSPESMQKLRDLLNNNTEPAESIARDRATGADGHLGQTPGFVFVTNGQRQTFSGQVTFAALKSYLDELLEQQ
jgi:protein-disulfide isomerase